MYLANGYVRIDGKMYTRGEEIPEGLPEEKLRWLIEAGAVKEAAPAPSAPKTQDIPVEEPEEPEQEAEEEPEEPAEEDAPEIDVMDGIVNSEPDPEEKKPAKAKSTAKKQAERRKSR